MTAIDVALVAVAIGISAFMVLGVWFLTHDLSSDNYGRPAILLPRGTFEEAMAATTIGRPCLVGEIAVCTDRPLILVRLHDGSWGMIEIPEECRQAIRDHYSAFEKTGMRW